MKKEHLLLVIVVILITILVINHKESTRYKGQIESQLKVIKDLSDEKNNIVYVFSKTFKINNFSVNKNTTIKDKNNNAVSFRDLLDSVPTLILYMPKSICNYCFDNLFVQLGKIIESYPCIKIITICPHERFRETSVFLNQYKMVSEVYSISSKENFINEDLLPVLFFVDSSMVLRDSFIPDQYNFKFTENYIESVLEKLSKFNQ
ncbi:hypothetical protein MM239_12605 [Belliella sp. DSM 111904]|uniref:AhpC/TSA family protein n=1 Tax=Belliella filtrata TaxID=2923435 RepID=A0ABS9V1E4_9BACT|nr:hypothetical protein [Belliella filtrata]MCH7410240.1 hypothetical protein [Belliella filtrata]